MFQQNKWRISRI